MILTKKIRIKLDNDSTQAVLLWMDANRKIYNHYLSKWKKTGKCNAYQNQKNLTEIKKYLKSKGNTDNYLFTTNLHSFQKTLFRLRDNIKSYFELKKNQPEMNPRPPRFRSWKYPFTLTLDQYIYKDGFIIFKSHRSKIFIPIDLEKANIKPGFFHLKHIEDDVFELSMIHSKENKNEMEEKSIAYHDVGISTYDTIYVEEENKIIEIENDIKPIAKYCDKQISKVQSKRDNKKKDSKRWNKLNDKKHELERKKINKVKHTLHKVTKELVKLDVDTHVVGDLNQKTMKMSVNEKKNRFDKNINKSLNNWYLNLFIWYLTYKCILEGKKVVKLNERNTTKTCSVCGHVKTESVPLNVRIYECEKCENKLGRDINSAFNMMIKYKKKKLKCCIIQPIEINDLNSARWKIRNHSLIETNEKILLFSRVDY